MKLAAAHMDQAMVRILKAIERATGLLGSAQADSGYSGCCSERAPPISCTKKTDRVSSSNAPA